MKRVSLSIIIASIAAVILLVGLAVLVIISGRQASSSADNKIKVVASTNVWGDIAGQIGGERVKVVSILSDPQADPHLFESDAKTASQIASAQLVITNGLGYDEFIDKLLGAASSNKAVMNVAEVLKAPADANPHLWYDLPRIPQVALAMRDELTKLDPGHAQQYNNNAQQFIVSLQPALAKLTAQTGAVAYTERVAGYLVADLGLINKTPRGFSAAVENGSEPTPQQIDDFQKVLRSGEVKVLLYNNQASNDVTVQLQKVAQAAGIAVIGVSETIPKGNNFQSWQLAQLNAILEAL